MGREPPPRVALVIGNNGYEGQPLSKREAQRGDLGLFYFLRPTSDRMREKLKQIDG